MDIEYGKITNDNTDNKGINRGGDYGKDIDGNLFVYSDECTGTDIAGYKNTSYRTSAGFGNYTRPLFTGEQNLIGFMVQPFINIIGYTIYIIILFTICMVTYVKTQSVMSPIIMAFLGGTAVYGSGYMPDEYRLPAMFITATAMAAIVWRLGKSA